ncbi:Y-family DNA polymerase [Pelagibacterium lentulum]|uniref:DNA-directed DNA polymerase n=1 Tax=Pelagibacterium lentulum TaxID=2029865 RepID=A0A916R787_9HYPH|nr:DNA polymerase Y family protein [Pelagibacterium lentulum]GGA38938.1 DNA-directed DNA polymerase [Pelagibacterium lentulum]
MSASIKRRYLALWLPYLSTERIERKETSKPLQPKQDSGPLVLVARKDSSLRIAAASAQAYLLGLKPGLTFADAKSQVPNMRVLPHDPQADALLLIKIANWCNRYTPIVCSQDPDGLILEISGSAHLFGGEALLEKDLAETLKSQGFMAKTAIAGTAQAARAFCRFGTGGILMPPKSRQDLLALPIDALEADQKTTLALRRAGLLSLNDLASRPRKPLAARFSSALTHKLAQVLEEIDEPIIAHRPVPGFHAYMKFSDPIGLMEDIEQALASLCVALCKKLGEKAQGGRHFELVFFRADGALRRLDILSGQALRDPDVLLRLIKLRLDALTDPLDPGFGFDIIQLAVVQSDTAPSVQNRLDSNQVPQTELNGLIDRLSARLGAKAIQKFIPLNSHLPERASYAIPALSKKPGSGTWELPPSTATITRPLFLMPQPEEVAVIAEVPDGPPKRFRWRGSFYDIALAEGPERIAPEWWRETRDRLTRDYFRVEDNKGLRFWLFRYGLYDREKGPVRWFIHGLFP